MTSATDDLTTKTVAEDSSSSSTTEGQLPPTVPYEIACDYIHHRITKEGRTWWERPVEFDYGNTRQYSQLMRSLGEEFESGYSKDFGDMCHRLKITPDSAYSTFITVCEELFKGKVEWSHIVALFAFAGGLALECHRQNYPELVGLVADWTATFVETHLDVWIAQRGRWDGFVHVNQNCRHVQAAAHRLSVLFTEFLAKVDEEFGVLSVAALAAHVAKMVSTKTP